MEMLASYSWGKEEVQGDGESTVWKLNHKGLSWLRPQEDLISYREYLEKVYPDKTAEEEPDDAARNQYNKQVNMQRRDIMQNFIKPHQPGVSLKSEFERIIRRLNLPDFALDELGINKQEFIPPSSEDREQTTSFKEPLSEIFKDGKLQLFKSFFQMLINLKNHKREFSVVFRGFGNDLTKVVSEFNRFCEGAHPLYNGRHGTKLARFDGSKGSKNFIIDQN
mmetsp:Transcript_14031/g.12009  ORF Transcript_14031/g.12009 Transcript_14031/m.12009 type:complete len:222 (-) Transcript_14031:826-1491(-)